MINVPTDKEEMIASDLLMLVITGLVSLYPISRLVKYRDRKKCMN